jgi:phosphoglycerate kinase
MRFLRSLARKAIQGKTWLVRVDFNIGEPEDVFRIEATLPTIRFLLARGGRVVLLSHRGRPDKPDPRQSLRSVLPILHRKLQLASIFLPSHDFTKVQATLDRSRARLFLLENLRFLPGERKNDATLARELASLGDCYANDAFSVSHRREASVVALPRLLPAYAGLLLEQEVQNLSRAFKKSDAPLVIVVGGAKVPEKMGFVQSFLHRADAILVGGVTANTFLKARGTDIADSVFDPAFVPAAKQMLRTKHLVLPSDFITERGKILDIGPLTSAAFSQAIGKAKTVIWSGPMGMFEDERYASGTIAVARAIARSQAFSIAGGGETGAIILRLKLQKKISFLSTGGGAMLEFLTKGTLPGIEALNVNK